MVPAVCCQNFGGGFWVFVIADEQARRLDQDLAVVGHFDFHTAARHTHCVGTRFVVGLQAHKHSGFGGAIQLLQVNANRAIEGEQIGANGLACGVGHAHSAKPKVVAQGGIDQHIAQSIQEAVEKTDGLTRHAFGADLLGQVHEIFVNIALERAGVFHPNAHAGQHAFKYARWREVIGGANLFQVDGDGGHRLGAVDHVAGDQPLRIAENILPNPSGR